ncbi:uncharacterized protein BO87DRAFT_399789 [Aspergillus neoniger CBS 115656]|uniref:Uncharacterized protein n=1 Tax=Aspergillus neoniger (strain CBS 115656) TaxID=1448310 RepID=A0A318Y9T6_ASPNB|nr:hypothetical protein BO87DRAFT_399789 [Aspergillus neoniger CBS 115656]PYH31091.1 hypothetical protein BO87DRAFT_399789 [Aspergillus neoniger CBS 115656]
MILEYLSPTDLLRLFCTSKIALDYGDSVMRTKPRQFYRKLIRYIATESIPPTVEIWAPKKLVNHAYGLWNSFADLTTGVEVITVYGIRIKDHVYVCGIDFLTRSTHQHIGHHSKLVSRVEILPTQVYFVYFLADAFGIRGLKFGFSAWSFEEPKSDQCWEGFSIRRREGRLRIVRDAVKFRYIGWCSDTTPSFEETLLVRSRNAFYKSDIDENDYFPLYPYREEQLVSDFGNVTVEALWVTEDLSGVTIYSDPDVISGVAMHDSSGTSIVGDDAGDKDYLPIHGPDEFLAGVVVRMHPFYDFPLLKLKTNRGRQCSSLSSVSEEEYSSRNIETLEDCYIKGFYFRLEFSSILSIGVIYGNLGESDG